MSSSLRYTFGGMRTPVVLVLVLGLASCDPLDDSVRSQGRSNGLEFHIASHEDGCEVGCTALEYESLQTGKVVLWVHDKPDEELDAVMGASQRPAPSSVRGHTSSFCRPGVGALNRRRGLKACVLASRPRVPNSIRKAHLGGGTLGRSFSESPYSGVLWPTESSPPTLPTLYRPNVPVVESTG